MYFIFNRQLTGGRLINPDMLSALKIPLKPLANEFLVLANGFLVLANEFLLL